MGRIKVGDRVKPSREALAPALERRSKWLSWSSQYASLDEAYKREAARRGTVTELTPSKYGAYYAGGARIKWDDGSESHGFESRVELAEDAAVSRIGGSL